MPIPVICDRCRATGLAGEADFSHLGDLLDFEPMPRQPRANGWDADAQRGFIALLAVTGSKTRAARALGRNAYGIDQILKAESGNAGFRLAYDRALAIARQQGAMKLAQGVADAAARNAQLAPPSRLAGLAAAPGEEESRLSEEGKREVFDTILAKFARKVAAEREARLAGRVVEADFCLRQVTAIEVCLDLMATHHGFSPFDLLAARREGRSLVEIAETPFSRLLDALRREQWQEAGEPDRPEHPPRRYLEEHDGYSLEPAEFLRGGSEEYHAEQRRAFEARHAEDAADQVLFEAAARQEYELRAAKAKAGE